MDTSKALEFMTPLLQKIMPQGTNERCFYYFYCIENIVKAFSKQLFHLSVMKQNLYPLKSLLVLSNDRGVFIHPVFRLHQKIFCIINKRKSMKISDSGKRNMSTALL